MKLAHFNIIKKFRQETVISVIIVAFIVSGLILLPYYKYSLNPDGVGYFDAAIKYGHWHISQAVNGAWSPLLSWLLVPFVWLHKSLQVAYFLLAIVSSVLALVATNKILKTFVAKWYVAASLLAVAAVMLLSWSLAGPITGDIFAGTAGLWLALSFKNFVQKRSWPSIVLLAANGAVFYFAKSIGFFVFIATLVVLIAVEYRAARASTLFKRYCLVGLVFLAICAPWVGAISVKYKTLTVSTVGTSDFYLATQYNAVSDAYDIPLTVSGPYAPLPHDITPWDDPSVFKAQEARTFHDTKLSVVIDNYYHSLLHNLNVLVTGIAPALLAIGAVGIYILYKKERTIAMVLALVSVVTLIGCVLSYLELRYLYVLSIALLVGLAVIINAQTKKVALLGAVSALLMVIAPIQTLVTQTNYGRAIYFDAQTVSKIIPSGSHVLSDDPSVIYYCYYGNFKCYYTVVSTDGLAAYIQVNHIHYFILSNVRNILSQPNFWQIMKAQNVTVVRPAALAALAGK